MRRPLVRLVVALCCLAASSALAHPRHRRRVYYPPTPALSVVPFGAAVALGPHLSFGVSLGAPVVLAQAVYDAPPPLVEAEYEDAPPPPLVEVEVEPPMPPPPMVQVEVAPPPPAPAPVIRVRPAPAPVPVVRAAPPPPPPAVRRAPQREEEPEEEPSGPPRLAIKWAPFARSVADLSRLSPGYGLNAGSVGLEFRFNRYLALRSDVQYSQEGGLWDVAGLKLSVFPNSFVRPFAAAGISGIRVVSGEGATRVDSTRLGVVAGLGLNLFFGQHVFLEAEAKYRHYSDDPFNAMAVRNLSSWTALLGAGVAFF